MTLYRTVPQSAAPLLICMPNLGSQHLLNRIRKSGKAAILEYHKPLTAGTMTESDMISACLSCCACQENILFDRYRRNILPPENAIDVFLHRGLSDGWGMIGNI